jgi:hypothetical protein
MPYQHHVTVPVTYCDNKTSVQKFLLYMKYNDRIWLKQGCPFELTRPIPMIVVSNEIEYIELSVGVPYIRIGAF